MNEDSPPEKGLEQVEEYTKLAMDDEADTEVLKGPKEALSGAEELTSASDGSSGNAEIKKRSLSDVV